MIASSSVPSPDDVPHQYRQDFGPRRPSSSENINRIQRRMHHVVKRRPQAAVYFYSKDSYGRMFHLVFFLLENFVDSLHSWPETESRRILQRLNTCPAISYGYSDVQEMLSPHLNPPDVDAILNLKFD